MKAENHSTTRNHLKAHGLLRDGKISYMAGIFGIFIIFSLILLIDAHGVIKRFVDIFGQRKAYWDSQVVILNCDNSAEFDVFEPLVSNSPSTILLDSCKGRRFEAIWLNLQQMVKCEELDETKFTLIAVGDREQLEMIIGRSIAIKLHLKPSRWYLFDKTIQQRQEGSRLPTVNVAKIHVQMVYCLMAIVNGSCFEAKVCDHSICWKETLKNFRELISAPLSLNNSTLSVVLPNIPVLSICTRTSANGICTKYKGAFVELLDSLAQRFKFRFHYCRRTPTGVDCGENDTHAAADLQTVGDMGARNGSSDEFISYILHERPLSLIMKVPQVEMDRWAFSNQFHWALWLATFITLTFVGLFITVFSRVDQLPWHQLKRRYWQSVPNSIWSVFKPFTNQGADEAESLTLSGQILFASWCWFILVLAAYYTANLYKSMTTTHLQLPYSSLEDLAIKVTNGELRFALDVTNPFALNYFNTSANPSLNQIYKVLVDKPPFYPNLTSLKEGLLADKDLIAALDQIVADAICRQECNLYCVALKTERQMYASIKSLKDSCLHKIFWKELIFLFEMGMMQRWLNKHKQKDICVVLQSLTTLETRSLNFDSLFGTWVFLLSMLFLAMFAFTLEKLYCHRAYLKEALKSMAK